MGRPLEVAVRGRRCCSSVKSYACSMQIGGEKGHIIRSLFIIALFTSISSRLIAAICDELRVLQK